MLTPTESLALRSALSESYQHAPDGFVQELLNDLSSELNAAELAGIGRAIRSVVPKVLKAGQKAAPGAIGGATTGATVGGPWGALIGGVAGGGLSLAGGAKPRTMPQPATPPAPKTVAAAPGAQSAAQLLQLIGNPSVLQALLALAMGNAGRSTIPVGPKTVPPASVAALLGTLAARAAHRTESVDEAEGDADALIERFTEDEAALGDWQETLMDPLEWLGQAAALSDDDDMDGPR